MIFLLVLMAAWVFVLGRAYRRLQRHVLEQNVTLLNTIELIQRLSDQDIMLMELIELRDNREYEMSLN